MAGHSKWHNIRLRKGAQDARKGKIFTKLAREIIVAAKEGGGNPEMNGRLRLAIEKARDASMPVDNIKRAIQRGTGEGGEAVNYQEMVYEGYAPGGTAVMVSVLTDNKNRTVADLRSIFSRNGGSLGETGCVAWMFEQKGVISISTDQVEEDALLEIALEAGADDVRTEDDTFEVLTSPENFSQVKDAIVAAGLRPSSAEVTMLPKSTVSLGGKEAEQVLRLLDMLDDHDDVQQVYANFDISDRELEAAAA
ncbi:MAG TPA: YebC/PmpR family DNA-binding transcriptional regulator [Armatimonadota bacterium]|jgi:YebC/PmpR family DNA-binding regulatory protein|nr:YebC/PmpR family DNA-binding transcriptional regulator [Armatimonadota bacterium]HOJ23437.1 YebC/PmpR family DNA-binding transcriptional regulator [Armatimonadota bacterium]HOM83106.1 YebC/PmpR family DNA-binding transcriptional regulator [Armatimonadota bacterium]HOQ28731.1 YebC/PmpR family DNA-binding transcriptional regulator [Armatimonadota bacterium]HPO73030.1 YebC/PmpR family DNA-binding transcriptional regulator [Armatimonadota bacterium]